MKRKQILAVLMAMTIVATGMFAGCGTKSESGSSTSSASSASSTSADSSADSESDSIDEEVDEYTAYENMIASLPVSEETKDLNECIKLGEYKGLKLTKTISEVTDEAVRDYAESEVDWAEIEDENATAEIGNMVDIAYAGTIDGEEFDGGSSESYELELGSGEFIEGFEDGVVGMKKGEEKDINLTFPEDYYNEDLAGKDVVFHVTVNSINEKGEVSQEALDAAREELEKEYEQEAESSMESDAWMQVRNNTEFVQINQEDIDKYVAETRESVESWAESMNMSFEDYIGQMDMTEEQYNEEVESYAKESACEAMLINALAEAEGITEDSGEFKAELAKLVEENETTEEDLMEQGGESTIKQYVMTSVLIDRIISYADVTEERVSGDYEDVDSEDVIEVVETDNEAE